MDTRHIEIDHGVRPRGRDTDYRRHVTRAHMEIHHDQLAWRNRLGVCPDVHRILFRQRTGFDTTEPKDCRRAFGARRRVLHTEACW